MTLEYVDVETAKAAKGTRLVVNALVPSPWSEAMKGLFAIGELSALVVRRAMDTQAIDAWTGVDNAPALFHDREPIRTSWAAIVAFVDRMAPARAILPAAPAQRALAIGTIDALAGEGGIGWNARLAMIDASLASNGASGFPLQIAKYLGKRYGYSTEAVATARERMTAQMAFLASQLTGEYFGGAAPNAVDVYSATFLTPVAAPITDAECPGILPPLAAAFTSAHAAFGALVPPALLAHRTRMFERHLPRPIRL
jgi:glutathione S-transferase